MSEDRVVGVFDVDRPRVYLYGFAPFKPSRLRVRVTLTIGTIADPPDGGGVYVAVRGPWPMMDPWGGVEVGPGAVYVGKAKEFWSRLTHLHHRWSEIGGSPGVFVGVDDLSEEGNDAGMVTAAMEYAVESAIDRTTNAAPISGGAEARFPEGRFIAESVCEIVSEVRADVEREHDLIRDRVAVELARRSAEWRRVRAEMDSAYAAKLGGA